MRTETSQETLMLSVAVRDVEAFRALYNQTCGRLMAIALRICRDRAVAEDVLQEVYIQIWRRADSYDPTRCAAIAWMSVIARNRAIDHVRRHGRAGDAGGEAADYDIEMLPSPAAGTDQAGALRDLTACLGRLGPHQQEAVLLAYYNGLSRQELADHFGVPENTVKTWLRRGLLSLRHCMEGSDG
jgi:RNA polymerase sigma-70 factor, ECF subfamily